MLDGLYVSIVLEIVGIYVGVIGGSMRGRRPSAQIFFNFIIFMHFLDILAPPWRAGAPSWICCMGYVWVLFAVADLGMCAHPSPIFFHCHAVFGKNLAK